MVSMANVATGRQPAYNSQCGDETKAKFVGAITKHRPQETD